MSEFNLVKAEKKRSKMRLGVKGVSGSGKTYSALLLAKGLVGDWSKICVIDTENESASLYASLGGTDTYNIIPLKPPFSPERYISAIDAAIAANMECIIIDSITHEWEGTGGCLEEIESITQSSRARNSYTSWAKVTPRHNRFLQSILQSPIHMITTVRTKQDYDMTKDSEGKVKIEKVGMKEVTREGFEYELTISLSISIDHTASASKDRTFLFMDKPEFTISEETGKKIRDWCESGAVIAPLDPNRPASLDQKTQIRKFVANGYIDAKLEANLDDKTFTECDVFIKKVAEKVASKLANNV